VEAERPTLTVYARTYCHLCDDMIAALRNLQGRFAFEIKVVDVDSDAALEAQYGERVPVLTASVNKGERELCHYFLEQPVVTALLEEMR
jgi:RNA binding exosome subunit